MGERSEVGIVFDREREVLAKVARNARVWHEGDFALAAEPDIHDRIDDELVDVTLAPTPTDDRTNLHAEPCFREFRHEVVVFDIEAIPESLLARVGYREQGAQLHRVGVEISLLVDRPRNVESGLEPVRYAV